MILESKCQALLDAGNFVEYVDVVKSVIHNSDDEDLLAKLIGQIYERKITNGFWLVESFVDKYPNSLHIIRVYLADLFAQQGNFDAAANEARIYLRTLQEIGYLRPQLKRPILLEGVARAFMLLTSAYTEVGARSYSIRVLKRGSGYNLESHWQQCYDNELKHLKKELDVLEFRRVDELWESFFNTGKERYKVDEACASRHFDFLRKRMELISNNFTFNSEYKVDEQEQLQLVQVTEDNSFFLK